jgi:hypothetical protein
MENRGTLARLLSHMLPFLPVARGKASGCCRARRGSRRQIWKEVSNQRRQHKSLFAIPSTDQCLNHRILEEVVQISARDSHDAIRNAESVRESENNPA